MIKTTIGQLFSTFPELKQEQPSDQSFHGKIEPSNKCDDSSQATPLPENSAGTNRRIYATTSLTCRICGAKPSNSAGLRNHMLKAHITQHHIFCRLCTYSTNIIDLYRQHNYNKHDNQSEIPYKNEFHKVEPILKAILENKTERTKLNKPIVMESKPKSVQKKRNCRFCQTEQTVLMVHTMQSHQDEIHFLCPICPFRSRYDFRGVSRHMDAVHPFANLPIINMYQRLLPRTKAVRDFCFDSNPDASEVPPPGFLVKVDKSDIEENEKVPKKIKKQQCNLCSEVVSRLNFSAHAWSHRQDNAPAVSHYICDICHRFKTIQESVFIAHLEADHEFRFDSKGKDSNIWHAENAKDDHLRRLHLACFDMDQDGWTKEACDRHSIRLEKYRKMLDEGIIPPPPKTVAFRHLKLHTCVLCDAKVASKQFVQHISNRHFGRPQISCPICGKTEKYQRRNMVLHISRTHPGSAHMEPIDQRAEFHAQVIEQAEKCFPTYYNQPKLQRRNKP